MVTSELGACEWFVWDLRRSNLLDRGRLDQIVGEYLQKNPRAEPPALAEFLVGQGILTQFQSERLLQGKTQGFVLGPFVLMDALGAGSMGTVYKAQSKTDNNWFAVKVLPRRSMWNVRLARRKVRAFESCRHPSVVPFVDVGTSGGMHYLAWPLVEGETLEKFVQAKGRLSSGLAAHYALQVAEGLDACHSQDLIHGLLKPSNLMISSTQDQIYILDFGIGCLLAETEGESLVDTMSTANAVASGLDCASPESIMEPTNLTPLGDQYSLGCTLYFMLTGQYPFPDGAAAEKMMAHQFKQPTPIAELNPDVPQGLVDVVNRLLAKAPDQRYGTAGDVVEALKPFAQKGSGVAPRPRTPQAKDSGARLPNSGIHSGVNSGINSGVKSTVQMPSPSVSSQTPAPKPAPRSGMLGAQNIATPKPPSTPLPRTTQPASQPSLPVRPSGSASRPVTMMAIPPRASAPATPPPPAPPVRLQKEQPPAEAEDFEPMEAEKVQRFDERVGPMGIVILTTLLCSAIFFAINYFKLI
ncbi:MAG: protein kinase [Planctomycetota bacterium]